MKYITGTILEVMDRVQVSQSFTKREFVLEYAENPKYPETIKFETIQDNCDLLDNVKKGDTMEVHFNLKGRAWTDAKGETKYFNSLQAWKLVSVSPTKSEGSADADSEKDDLPF